MLVTVEIVVHMNVADAEVVPDVVVFVLVVGVVVAALTIVIMNAQITVVALDVLLTLVRVDAMAVLWPTVITVLLLVYLRSAAARVMEVAVTDAKELVLARVPMLALEHVVLVVRLLVGIVL